MSAELEDLQAIAARVGFRFEVRIVCIRCGARLDPGDPPDREAVERIFKHLAICEVLEGEDAG